MEWAANNGKAVRQRTVRQETTFKVGMLPLNMYSTSGQPEEKITVERTLGHVDAAGNLGCPVEGGKSSEGENYEETGHDEHPLLEGGKSSKEKNYEETGHDDEQESEYDTQSESELPAAVE